MAICFAVAMIAGMATNMAFAEKKSPFESGRAHGCDDAFKDFDERYINQPGKGEDFHTSAFMLGYTAGFEGCAGIESQEENSWTTEQSQTQRQTIKCGNIVVLSAVTCSNEAGQGQESSQ